MAKSDTLPIFLDTYRFVLEIYQTTAKFSREHKYSLGMDLRRDAMEMLRLIYQANHHSEKAAYLTDFLATFEMVRIQLRLCHDVNALSLRKTAYLALIMEKIGKQATAWKKHAKAKETKSETTVNKEEVNKE